MQLRFDRKANVGHENRGFVLDEVSVFEGDQKIGYLKMEYIPSENFRAYYPSIMNYLSQIIGVGGAFPADRRHVHYSALSDPELVKLICNTKSLRIPYSASDFEGLDRGELLSIVDEIEQRLWKDKIGRQFEAFKDFHVDKPFVAYVQVDNDRQRQGIGSMLYAEAAEWMREKGYVFRSSRLQSDEAKGVWAKFTALRLTRKDRQGRLTLVPSAASVIRSRQSLMQYA